MQEKIIPPDKWSYTSKPDIQKVYTTREVADLLNISDGMVRGIVNYHGLDQQIVITKNSRAAVYTYDTVRQIKEIHEAREKKMKVAEQQKLIKNMETDEEAALHPLVKDKRFLKLSYFPETVPNCFEE